jgi:hypothetical protein
MWTGTHEESREYARFLLADDFLMSVVQGLEVIP